MRLIGDLHQAPKDSKQHPVVCCTELQNLPSDVTILAFRGSRTCLREVVQLPRVAPEAHPPRADPPVDLVRQVRGFSDGTSQIGGREVVWRYCCPVVLKSICVAGARGLGMYMVAVMVSEMARPNALKTSTKTAIIPPAPARRPRHDVRVVSMRHPPNSTPHTFQGISGQLSPAVLARGQDLRVCLRPR